MIERSKKADMAVISQTADELVLEGEYGKAFIDKNGSVKTEVAGYATILSGNEIKPKSIAKPPAAAPTQSAPVQPAPNVPAGKTHCIYDDVMQHFGPDLHEVFGDTGTMKSKGMVALATECAKAGRTVYYLDTENNISPKDIAMLRALGVNYQYTPVLKQIDEIIEKKIPTMKVDLIIIDSVGMPVLRKFSNMGAHERGTALLDIIKWLGTLKEWTFTNKSMAFVTNQPQSEFGKSSASEKGDNRMPFGDKSNFIPGTLLLSKKTLDSKEGSKAVFQAFRLRDHAKAEPVFEIGANKDGAMIKLVLKL